MIKRTEREREREREREEWVTEEACTDRGNERKEQLKNTPM